MSLMLVEGQRKESEPSSEGVHVETGEEGWNITWLEGINNYIIRGGLKTKGMG